TPMNLDVRAQFRSVAGFDPLEVFQSRHSEADRNLFLEFRRSLVWKMQSDWIGQVEEIRKRKPYLDLVLTHVDDRFDTGMRDAIGADSETVLPLLDRHDFTFLVEDPATVWNLGSGRYPEIAAKYGSMTRHTDRLAVDLNIVDRYQDV